MNKRFLCALSCLGLMFSLSACNNNDTQEQQGYPALFELKRESATLDLFSSLQLETVDEIDGTIIYSSDNESIASVDINGVVHTHSTEGQANISATYGYTTKTCKISVIANSNINFEFDYQNVNVELYETLRIPYAVIYDGKDVTDDVNVQFSIEDEDYLSLAEVYGKNALGVTAKKLGKTQVSVYTTISGTYYSDVINVNVVRPDYVIYSPDFGGEVNNYACDLYVYSASSEHVTSINLDNVKIYYAGTEITGATYSAEILDETIAKIDGSNNLVPLKTGKTVLTLKYQDNTFLVNVNVKKETYDLDKHITIDKNQAINELNLSGVTLIGTPNNLIIDSCNTSIFGSYSVGGKVLNINPDKIPLNTKYLLNQKLTLETDLAMYKLDSTIYTAIIHNKSDLERLEVTCNAGGGKYDGYIIMANNIAWDSNVSIFASNKTYSGGEMGSDGFGGVFDGNGYAITGFNSSRGYKGLFGNILATSSTIKNLSITGVSLGSGKTSVLSVKGFGVTENIYIEVSSVNSGATGGGLYSCWDGTATPSSKGVLINYGDDPITAAVDAPNGNGGISKGFIPATFQDTGSKLYCISNGTYSVSGVNCTHYDTYAALNDDIAKARADFIYPFWNNDVQLSFAGYHQVTF